MIWKIEGTLSEIWRSPVGLTPKSMTWHSEERALFVLAGAGSEHQILRLEPGTPAWTSRVIHRSKAALRRLVVGPRPFVVELEPEPKLKQARRYRLFFGQASCSGVGPSREGRSPRYRMASGFSTGNSARRERRR